jgi:predicted aspartyl protease
MPLLTLPLEPQGAIVTVAFAVSGPRQAAMRKAGLAVPPPAVVRALIDTGASCTCVDPAVVGKLGLSPSGTVEILTPSTGDTPHTCRQFDVAVAVIMDGSQVHLSSLIIPVIESDLCGQENIQALLGRDVLDQGLLVYHGRGRLLTLAF